MPDTNENWLGLINSCVNFSHQTHEIYQAEILWVRQGLVNVIYLE